MWIGRVLDGAPQQFDRAFDRWRELYRAALRQLVEAQNALIRARRPDDQALASGRQQEALRQRNLLLQINTSREDSDFYPYRYLASEGFLPGYNFPACRSERGFPEARVNSSGVHGSLPSASSPRQHPLPRGGQVGGGQFPVAAGWAR